MKKTLVSVAVLLMLSSTVAIAQELCFGDFDCDGDVDGTDTTTFLDHLGRYYYNDPCPTDQCDGQPAPVPKTGQTTSYETGDDGDYEEGVEWPDPRFTDHEDGSVTDNLNGLIWTKNAQQITGEMVWYDALTACNDLA